MSTSRWRCNKWTLDLLPTVLGEGRRRQQVLQNLAILLKGTLHLLPGHELTHLFGQFPEFLKQNTSFLWKGTDVKTWSYSQNKTKATPTTKQTDKFRKQRTDWLLKKKIAQCEKVVSWVSKDVTQCGLSQCGRGRWKYSVFGHCDPSMETQLTLSPTSPFTKNTLGKWTKIDVNLAAMCHK